MTVHVLIVDDNPLNQKLARDVLALAGFEVRCAADAPQCEQQLAQALPDIILMDLGLPGMDGLTLTRKLKGDPRSQHIPIMAFTAFAMKGDDQKALEAGCDGYVSKPIDTRRFAQQVHDCLDSARAARLAT